MKNIQSLPLQDPQIQDTIDPKYNPRENMTPSEIFNDSKNFLIQYYSSQKALDRVIFDLTKEYERHTLQNSKCSFTRESIYENAKDIIKHRIQRIWEIQVTFKNKTSPRMRWSSKIKFSYTDDSIWSSHLNHSIDYKKNKVSYYKDAAYDTYIHEIAHISTLWNYWIMPYSKQLMNHYNLNDPHLDEHTEKQARTVSIKYFLYKFGICNPIQDSITAEHLMKLQKYTLVHQDEWNDLLELLHNEKTEYELSQLLNLISFQSSTTNSQYLIV